MFGILYKETTIRLFYKQKNLTIHCINNNDNNTKVGQSKENRKKGDIKLMLQ